MKISELILALQAVMSESGNMDVAYQNSEFGCHVAIDDLTVNKHNDPSRASRRFSADSPELGDTFLVLD